MKVNEALEQSSFGDDFHCGVSSFFLRQIREMNCLKHCILASSISYKHRLMISVCSDCSLLYWLFDELVDFSFDFSPS
jgi:hypothetical protein